MKNFWEMKKIISDACFNMREFIMKIVNTELCEPICSFSERVSFQLDILYKFSNLLFFWHEINLEWFNTKLPWSWLHVLQLVGEVLRKYLRCGREVETAEYNGKQQYWKLVQWK